MFINILGLKEKMLIKIKKKILIVNIVFLYIVLNRSKNKKIRGIVNLLVVVW